MKLGAENKKQVYALGTLGLIAAIAVYTQFFSGPPAGRPAASNRETASVPPSERTGPNGDQVAQRVNRGKSRSGEFRPVLLNKKKEDRPDVSTIDPSLRLDLLAKVMQVAPAGGHRDLFQISRTPPVTQLASAAPVGPEIKMIPFVGPRQPPPPPPPTPPPPPPPETPIPLRYYGYTLERPDGKKTAYFMDGDEILPAIEGVTLKGRYKIITIALDKVLIEDTQRNRRQSLNLDPEAQV
jgi:hypothetical protein